MKKRSVIDKIPAPRIIYDGKELLKREEVVCVERKTVKLRNLWIGAVAASIVALFVSVQFIDGGDVSVVLEAKIEQDNSQSSVVVAQQYTESESATIESVLPEEQLTVNDKLVADKSDSHRHSEKVSKEDSVQGQDELIKTVERRQVAEVISPEVLVAAIDAEPQQCSLGNSPVVEVKSRKEPSVILFGLSGDKGQQRTIKERSQIVLFGITSQKFKSHLSENREINQRKSQSLKKYLSDTFRLAVNN